MNLKFKIIKGCYHNQICISILPYLAQNHNQTILRYDLSEAQAGKEICDRRISVLKEGMIDYEIRNCLDIKSPADMKEAIGSNKTSMVYKLSFVKLKIILISINSSFGYNGDSIRFLKNYNIGTGVSKKLNILLTKNWSSEKILQMLNEPVLKILGDSVNSVKPLFYHEKERFTNEIWPCPDCDLCFTNNKDLNSHILNLHFGSQMNSFDKIKSIYSKKITDINENFQGKNFISQN